MPDPEYVLTIANSPGQALEVMVASANETRFTLIYGDRDYDEAIADACAAAHCCMVLDGDLAEYFDNAGRSNISIQHRATLRRLRAKYTIQSEDVDMLLGLT
jgi:hypothetical protein